MDKKISELTALTTSLNADLIAIVDVAGNETKKQTKLNFLKELVALLEPVGTITMWGNATPPAGRLICNGAEVSRTTYAALFAVIGTTFGAGDGSTTFNLPAFYDPVGSYNRAPVGAGDAVGLGEKRGSRISDTGYALITDSGHVHGIGQAYDMTGGGSNTFDVNNETESSNASLSDSGHVHGLPEILSLGVHFIIKY